MRIEDKVFHCRHCGKEFPGSVWQSLIDAIREDGHEPTNFEYCSGECIAADGWIEPVPEELKRDRDPA